MIKNKKIPTSRRMLDRPQQKSTVFSYYASRSTSDTNVGRIKNEVGKGLKWKFIPSFIAIAAILVSFAYAASLNTNPRIAMDKSEHNSLLQNEQVYQAAAQKLLSHSIFYRSKLLIDSKHIEQEMLDQFPELRSASLTIPLTSRRPILALEAVSPKLLLKTPDSSFVLDAKGRAVLKVQDPTLVDSFGLTKVEDDSGLQVTTGKAVLSTTDAAFIAEVAHQLTAKGIPIDTLVLPPILNELQVRLPGKKYYVKFNMLSDARLQTGSFLALKDKLDSDHTEPSEYIDVRVEERAFYK